MRAAFGFGQLHDLQFDAVLARGCGWFLSGVALIDEGDFHAVVGGRLHGLGEMCDLGAVIGVGGRDVQGQTCRAGNGRARPPPYAASSPACAWPRRNRPLTALGRRPQRSAVEDGRRRLGLGSGCQAQHGVKVLGSSLEAARRQPSLRLLVDRRPRRQDVGHPAPRCARLHHIAQPIEHLPQRVRTLARILTHQRQIRGDQRAFVIGHIRRVDFPGLAHDPSSEPPASTSITDSRVLAAHYRINTKKVVT